MPKRAAFPETQPCLTPDEAFALAVNGEVMVARLTAHGRPADAALRAIKSDRRLALIQRSDKRELAYFAVRR